MCRETGVDFQVTVYGERGVDFELIVCGETVE